MGKGLWTGAWLAGFKAATMRSAPSRDVVLPISELMQPSPYFFPAFYALVPLLRDQVLLEQNCIQMAGKRAR